MPLMPPKSADSIIHATTSANSSDNLSTLRECPSCKQSVSDGTDKFCRNCGLRILMHCAKCSNPVRPADKFCGSCGAKRWKFYEFWRYGILHRSPAFVIGVTGVVTVAYLSLLLYLRRRGGKLPL
uniref:DZANK-type domain-containing protein n=1 Tax=Panagrolaimus sp. ES5 TaxID=591445 RepID=A0AC34FS47_9BILA